MKIKTNVRAGLPYGGPTGGRCGGTGPIYSVP